MTTEVTIQFNEFDKDSGKPAVRKAERFGNISRVVPFGDAMLCLVQEVGAARGTLMIPMSRIYTVVIQEREDEPEQQGPEIYVPDLRAVSISDDLDSIDVGVDREA